MATPEIPTHKVCRYCDLPDNTAEGGDSCEVFDFKEPHVWIAACARCGQFVHKRGCAEAAGTHVNPAAAMRADLVEIDTVLTDAGIPQEFAGQPLTLPERVRWLVQAVETNRGAFRGTWAIANKRLQKWMRAESKLQECRHERNTMARKLVFVNRFPGTGHEACEAFNREYRDEWTPEEFRAFIKRHAARAETRCPARCNLNGRQCARSINHHHTWHCSEGCSWTDKDNL